MRLAAQDRNIRPPGCAPTAEGADAETRRDRDVSLQVRDVEPEQAWLPNKPGYHRIQRAHHSMLLWCTPARKPTRLPDRLREHGGDGAQTEGIVRGTRGMYEGGAHSTESDVWGAGWGQG